jgi:hypothetical protein
MAEASLANNFLYGMVTGQTPAGLAQILQYRPRQQDVLTATEQLMIDQGNCDDDQAEKETHVVVGNQPPNSLAPPLFASLGGGGASAAVSQPVPIGASAAVSQAVPIVSSQQPYDELVECEASISNVKALPVSLEQQALLAKLMEQHTAIVAKRRQQPVDDLLECEASISNVKTMAVSVEQQTLLMKLMSRRAEIVAQRQLASEKEPVGKPSPSPQELRERGRSRYDVNVFTAIISVI